jgi:hypothetical protein
MDWMTMVLFPAGAGKVLFSLRRGVKTGSGPQPASYPMGTGVLSQG